MNRAIGHWRGSCCCPTLEVGLSIIGTIVIPPVKPEALKVRDSHFAWLRTRLAVERTLMAWVRTATALIGFGFTIFQFFERLNQMPGIGPPVSPWTARIASLALVALGTAALIAAIYEYRQIVGYLWSAEFREVAGIGEKPAFTPALAVAVVLCLFGVSILTTLALRTTGSS